MMRNSTMLALAAALALPATAVSQDPAAVANGARVWSAQCTRCHNARPSTERTDAQWLTIMAHMRARGNLTRTQTRLVTAFLQSTNLPEVAAVPARAPASAAEQRPGPETSGATPTRSEPPATLRPQEWFTLALYLKTLVPPAPPER